MINEIYTYWFGDLKEDAAYFKKRNALWFGGTPEIDADIRAKFGKTLESAVIDGKTIAPEFKKWTETPKGALALIVLLDQFSLNLYREEPQSYLNSELVISVAKDVILRGWAEKFTVSEKLFLYLPLEHAENIPDQELSVSLFERMEKEAKGDAKGPAGFYLDYARRHARVVKKYGRFPDRNPVFGRTSTPEEAAFLASDEAPF
jgi:uncharacterized protein (DUF924 family)